MIRLQKIHFVGIGGSGMSGIAEILLTMGHEISGSDVKESPTVERLEARGARIVIGHKAENVEGVDVLVFSSAVKPDNVEVRTARTNNIPVVPRAEMLAELMRMKYSIAIAGSHGKTTTTSLAAMILTSGGLDPTVIIGGQLKQLGTGALFGEGKFLVAEADESDGSFLKLSPSVAVITNIDDDHMDYYGDVAHLTSKFSEFSNRVPFYGFSLFCIDDPRTRCITSMCSRKVVTYGFHEDADIRADDIRWEETGCRYQLISRGTPVGEIKVSLFGTHNISNSLAAAAIGIELGISFEHIAEALAAFQGVDRRLQFKGEGKTPNGGVWKLYDDYGHHPTEISATIAAARRISHKRLIVLFQPHRYSRTALLYDRFAIALEEVDKLWLLPIYAAGEAGRTGVTSDLIGKALTSRDFTNFQVFESSDLLNTVYAELEDGDLVLTLGAGDVSSYGERMLEMK